MKHQRQCAFRLTACYSKIFWQGKNVADLESKVEARSCWHDSSEDSVMISFSTKQIADLDNEAEAIAPEGQEGIDLLLCGRLPFKVEGKGNGGLVQLHVQAGHRGLEGVADLQPAGGMLCPGAVPQLYQAPAQGPPAGLKQYNQNHEY